MEILILVKYSRRSQGGQYNKNRGEEAQVVLDKEVKLELNPETCLNPRNKKVKEKLNPEKFLFKPYVRPALSHR